MLILRAIKYLLKNKFLHKKKKLNNTSLFFYTNKNILKLKYSKYISFKYYIYNQNIL